jgi:hypothetical protein
VAPALAAALPANPWTGRWQSGSDVITLTQAGSQISGTGPCPGTTNSAVNYSASASADSTTANFAYTSSVCTGTGGTFSATLAANGQTVSGSGITQFGTGFSFSWTYVGGGTEPRSTPPPPPPPPQSCPGGPWSGRWGNPSGPVTLVQSGQTVNGSYPLDAVGRPGGTLIGTVSGQNLSGSWRQPSGVGTFSYTLASDGRSYSGTNTGADGTITPITGSNFIGCPLPDPNLQSTIPNPQTLTNGPTTLVAPGTISLRSLKRSKCVLVKVASNRPARILVSIFSGRRSIRLFGQKLVVFFAPGRKQPCIPVPFRARTFNVRTPLNVALGYTAGTRPQRGGRKPRPVVKPISLVP